MTLAIHELTSDYERLADLDLDASESLVQPSPPIEALLASIQDAQGAKLLSLAKVVLCLEAEVLTLEQQTARLSGKIRARRQRIDFLKRWMLLQMTGADLHKVKDPFVTVWTQASPPSVQVLDEKAVPAEYQRAVLRLPLAFVPAGLRGYLQQLDIDKAAILSEAKRTGEVVSGVSILTGERHLRIG